MSQSIQVKLAKLVTHCEEVDGGGVATASGHRRDVWPEVQAILRDPEIVEWIDELRRQGVAPLRRLS